VSIAILAREGRSFRLAGRLLPGATLLDAAELYAFCRTVDDLADETSDAGLARSALGSVRRAILTGDRRHLEAARFLSLQDRTGVSASAAITLIDTVKDDIGPVRVADEAGLLKYAYGAAGTVGLMMCAVLDASNPWAQTHAIHLGIAMQLTNIARDVIEDAAHDRIYLPATWLPPGLQPEDIPDTAGPVFLAVQHVLACAARSYRIAELGYRYLPRRVRPAIKVAARLYEEIGLCVLHRGSDYLQDERCVVPMRRKLLVLAKCLGQCILTSPHDPAVRAERCQIPSINP
jgi:phytoene synthase